MKVHFEIYWNKTALFNEGNKELIMNWESLDGFPRQGELVNIPKFIENDYDANELFTIEDTQYNVFDWIENTTGWEIQRVKWENEKGNIFLKINISDAA